MASENARGYAIGRSKASFAFSYHGDSEGCKKTKDGIVEQRGRMPRRWQGHKWPFRGIISACLSASVVAADRRDEATTRVRKSGPVEREGRNACYDQRTGFPSPLVAF